MKHVNAKTVVSRITVLLLLLIMICMMMGCGQKAPPEEMSVPETSTSEATSENPGQTDPNATEEVEESEYILLETRYGELPFPREYVENLKHQEVVQESVAMEIFYLVREEQEMELYRIYFGDDTVGNLLGYLTVAADEIPVTYTVCSYEEEDLKNTETRAVYGNLMDGFSTLLSAISSDNRFSATRSEPTVQYSEREMRYWTVTLPAEIEWVETEENDIYRVDFYGNIRNERTLLYTFTLGDAEAPTLLGSLLVNGEQKSVGVQSHFTQPGADWTEEERSSAYRQMETVQLVIQAIALSENFST